MKNHKTARPVRVNHQVPASKDPGAIIPDSTNHVNLKGWDAGLSLAAEGMHKATVFADFGGRHVTPLDDW
jgi:hypothetical protein